MNVESTSDSLYFAAAVSAAKNQAVFETKKNKQKEKVSNGFSSLLKDKQEEQYFVSQGLPAELAGKPIDEAIDFLKDELDMAGDNFGINATPQAFDRYKKAVGQFIKFLEKNNYTIDVKKRMPRRGKAVKPAFQVIAINQELDRLAYDLWYNHLDKLKILEKVHEINGLVIDLLAA